MHKPAHLIGSAEAAELLGVDRATFNRWVASGRVHATAQLPGRTGARMFSRTYIESLPATAARPAEAAS